MGRSAVTHLPARKGSLSVSGAHSKYEEHPHNNFPPGFLRILLYPGLLSTPSRSWDLSPPPGSGPGNKVCSRFTRARPGGRPVRR
jgi:hypothetical protein